VFYNKLKKEKFFSSKGQKIYRNNKKLSTKVAETLNLNEFKEGNDDILKINFGGRNMDIKRSTLTKNNIGWNLFSCLFEKRWDGFHVRDREGRIYVDLKGKWLKPVIMCFHQNDVTSFLLIYLPIAVLKCLTKVNLRFPNPTRLVNFVVQRLLL
jgi:hypothetical protein